MSMSEAARVRAILVSPDGRAATGAGDVGTVIKTVRKGLGWSQSYLAGVTGYSQASISRLENKRTRVAKDIDALRDVTTALKIPWQVVDPQDSANADESDVDRRDFLGSAIAVSAMALLPRGLSDCGRVGAADVSDGWRVLNRLYEIDETSGGAAGHSLAVDLAERLQGALHRATFSVDVEKDLQTLAAAAMEHAGWVAYDGGDVAQSRRWWLEVSHLAGIANISEPHIAALTNMSLQSSSIPARSRETLRLTEAARRVAGTDASATLLSLLAARDAIAHAQTGDKEAARRALSSSREYLDRGRDGREPVIFNFWGEADLACHETRVALLGGDGRAASRAARAALSAVDGNQFPRNRAIYTVRLGNVLAQVNELDEAVGVTAAAVEQLDSVRGSQRVVEDLKRTIRILGEKSYKPARDFANAAGRVVG